MCEQSDSTELEASRRRAATLMKRLITHLRAQMDEQLRPHGVTKAQLQLMVAIQNAPGSSGAQLSRLCEVTPQTLHALIHRTEEGGWILREKDTVNDRIITATLTPAGEQLLLTARDIVKTIEARLWNNIPAASIESLSTILEHCLTNIT